MDQRETNFAFPKQHDPLLLQLAALAERYFTDDPNTCLIKLRQFGEVLAQQVAASAGVWTSHEESQLDLLNRLRASNVLPPQAADIFHSLRRAGNLATYNHAGTHGQALQHLKLARELAVWFHRSSGGVRGFKVGPLVPPKPLERADERLTAELAALDAELDKMRTAAERAAAEASEEAKRRLGAEERAELANEERAFWEQMAEEAEFGIVKQADVLATVQADVEQAPQVEIQVRISEAKKADAAIESDEAATRTLIDEQLRLRGWECDSATLTYAGVTRPHKTRDMARRRSMRQSPFVLASRRKHRTPCVTFGWVNVGGAPTVVAKMGGR